MGLCMTLALRRTPPQVTMCALAYDDAIALAATRPSFRVFASLPLAEASSGVWQQQQLFVLTPSAVVLAFAAAGGGGGTVVGLGGTDDPFLEVCSIDYWEEVAGSLVCPWGL
jgi:hypothetical protein